MCRGGVSIPNFTRDAFHCTCSVLLFEIPALIKKSDSPGQTPGRNFLTTQETFDLVPFPLGNLGGKSRVSERKGTKITFLKKKFGGIVRFTSGMDSEMGNF